MLCARDKFLKYLYTMYVCSVFSDNLQIQAIEEELFAPDETAIISDTPSNLETKRNRRLYLERQLSNQLAQDDSRPPLQRTPSTPMSPTDRKRALIKQLSRQKSINEPPSKETVAKKDENTRLIADERAETGNVSIL